MYKAFIFAALAVLGVVNARTSGGLCSNPQLQENFDATKYTGAWFNVGKDPTSVFENGNCEQARYSINTDGTLRVYNSQYNNDTKEIEVADGVAVC